MNFKFFSIWLVKMSQTMDDANLKPCLFNAVDQNEVGQGTNKQLPSEKLNELVTRFEKFDETTNDGNCRDVLLNVFDIGKDAKHLSREQKDKIAKILKNKASFMDNYLITFGLEFNSVGAPSLLKFRSALEYMKKFYGCFPVDGEGKNIDLDEDNGTSEVLDEAVSFLKKHLYVGIEPEGYSFEDLLRPCDIPKSHTWWFNVDENGVDQSTNKQSLSEKLNELVTRFEKFDETTNEENCRDVLFNVFEIGKDAKHLSREQKDKIAKILKNKASFMDNFLITFGFEINSVGALALLKFRSALEFIKKLYGCFPVDGEGKNIDLDEDNGTSEVLDEAVSFFKNHLLGGLEPVGYSFEDLLRPCDIPKSHTW
ncbi:uncharacterized protein LOC106065707 isoform X1 [Biomphalaria glabrata]|uniref:Uncharacterized protein LOC106065707 isoform X1 n=2 Tax=Biomphalaria glabrata TaxID=6526 RepID=A0A9W3ALL1_BIOGL|nr:uncharacterized protein LOC106065707 isoform X1 [Biomphalaria glabrata]